MKKYLQIFMVFSLLSCFIFGCGTKNYNAIQENHAAVKTYREGKWNIRYKNSIQEGTDRIINTKLFLSVNAEQDLTEEEMLEIMNYYEFTQNAQWDMNGNYVGERETDYICYAVFYKGETEEETRRIKYCNGKEAEIPEEEQGYFPKPNMCSSEEEIGEEGENGPLP